MPTWPRPIMSKLSRFKPTTSRITDHLPGNLSAVSLRLLKSPTCSCVSMTLPAASSKPLLPWLISVPAMIDESDIPRFKQRLQIRYDHWPAFRHGSDELGVGPFNRMGERELRGRPRGLNLVHATGVALCLEL